MKCFKIVFLGLVFLSLEVKAQNDFFFTHYMFNPSYFNAGWVGVENESKLFAIHRNQWAGYSATVDPGGAPTSQLVSLVVPARIGRITGLGATFINDRVADNSSIEGRLSIATNFNVRKGTLVFGISPALSVRSTTSNFRAVDSGDPNIPDGSSQAKPNVHAGLVYLTNSGFSFGLSADNLLTPNFDFGTESENEVPLQYALFISKTLGVSRDLLFRPSLLIRSDLTSYTFDIGGLFLYQETMWAGLSFRRSESISLLVGYSFLEDKKLSFGYSFDYVIEEREAKEPTSHEIFIRYNLPNLILGGKKAVKTPRFTF